MYRELTREDLHKVFENQEEKQYVIYGSAELIDKIEQAITEDIKSRLELTELEKKIIELRKEGLTYHAIQLALGNPSKKFIKDTLKQYAPELVGDVVKNYGKLRKP